VGSRACNTESHGEAARTLVADTGEEERDAESRDGEKTGGMLGVGMLSAGRGGERERERERERKERRVQRVSVSESTLRRVASGLVGEFTMVKRCDMEVAVDGDMCAAGM
jgi:hypothetical protein